RPSSISGLFILPMASRGRVRGLKLRNGIGPNSESRANAASVAAIPRPYFRFLISIARLLRSKVTSNVIKKLDGGGHNVGVISQRHVDLRSESQGNSR